MTVDKLFLIIGEDIKKEIDKIHDLPMTTRGNYGSYINVLTTLKKVGIPLKLSADLMVKAGANPEGVNSACQIF